MKKCANCGKQFQPNTKHPDKIYCGPVCHRKVMKGHMRNRIQAHLDRKAK